MRLLYAGLGIIWIALSVLGYVAWKAASDKAVQTGTPPPLVDVFPMVMLPAILGLFSLIPALRPARAEKKEEDQ